MRSQWTWRDEARTCLGYAVMVAAIIAIVAGGVLALAVVGYLSMPH